MGKARKSGKQRKIGKSTKSGKGKKDSVDYKKWQEQGRSQIGGTGGVYQV